MNCPGTGEQQNQWLSDLKICCRTIMLGDIVVSRISLENGICRFIPEK